ncbi:MAG: DegV family protein [Candidatus Pacebacteria bacterium]|nr:DegV family protein [Candidatus Paceibacterota bacterium]
MKTAVLVCNFASISEEAANSYGIVPIVSPLNWPESESLVGENIYQKMKDALKKGIKTLPKTSQPSIGTFKKYFENALKENDHLICITISSKISGTHNAALQTRKFFPEDIQKRIRIIDSNNIDAAESLLAIKAVELSKKEEDIEKIVEEIESYVPKTYFYGMTENPDQMEAGGRIGHVLAAVLSQMQKIGMRPILHMKEGVVKPANLRMNAKDISEALFNQFEDTYKKSLSEGKMFKVAISHADNISGAERLKSLFEKKHPSQAKIEFVSMTGIFIGSHVGPGTLMCGVLEE